MSGGERLTALRSHLHAPRSVRVRLTVLYGVVVFLAGASLLAITFLVGGHHAVQVRSVKVSGRGVVPFIATGQFPIRAVPGGPLASSSGGSLIVILGTGGGPPGLAVSQAKIAAQIGSSGAVRSLLVGAGIGLLIVTLAGVAVGWVMSGRMLRPLRKMTNTTRHISEENLHERLALSGPAGDELTELGNTIDGLLARLETAFDAQGRFVQNASHELRTPLAMMRTSLDVAVGKPGGVPVEVTVLAAKLREGLDQAERLLESFLMLARAQNGTAIERSTISLTDVVTDALRGEEQAIDALGLRVERTDGDAVVLGSATLLARVVGNLLDNAVRHNEPGGWIHVATSAEGASARLTVENGGVVIDPDRVGQLGQPFQRLVADRTASDRGVGLGLSIVSAIATAHEGTMEVDARPAGGLRVTVTLPAALPAVSSASAR
jgi:signal transduction histidine kinase